MKFKFLIFYLLLVSCNPIPTEDLIVLAGDEPESNILCDFIPAVQPFVNEGCNTAWDNISAIVENDEIIYFVDLPDYTPNPYDYDKSRFTFIYQVKNPYFGLYQDELPYARIQTNWYVLPIDDYGNMTCQGLQEVRIWVLDENTNFWYMNSQVCWAGYLCSGQYECSQGYIFDDIQYPDYSSGFLYLQESGYSEN